MLPTPRAAHWGRLASRRPPRTAPCTWEHAAQVLADQFPSGHQEHFPHVGTHQAPEESVMVSDGTGRMTSVTFLSEVGKRGGHWTLVPASVESFASSVTCSAFISQHFFHLFLPAEELLPELSFAVALCCIRRRRIVRTVKKSLPYLQ